MTGSGLMTILTLAILECLLSVDNAVVLAAQTATLGDPKKERSALMWGLWGSYIFRFIAIGLGSYLIKFWGIKALGSAYLLYMAVHFFYEQHQPQTAHDETPVTKPHSFWGTVAAIVLLDIVFSIDSILTALALDNNPVIVLLGGMIGILAMRFVAQMMIALLARIPELLTMAYVLIGFIAIKLGLSLPMIDIEVSNTFFSIFVLLAFGFTIGLHYWRQKHTRADEEEH
ncbi:TerC family protein [Lacticaseibacillus baoqingensis]|uniref:TerC family protein n=1 Tax=Lacticaseibacillus baoqingensis TaxID=2486013 RepID=A0ABW4E8I4_9LACO|nr:TerC family protein [Lacticaseibacillus baoqingensis]